MPTKKQLYQRWESEMEFGKSHSEEYNVRGSEMAGTGNDPFQKPFTGEKIGHFEWDEKNQDFKLIVDSTPSANSNSVTNTKE
jgi:hypothetical protein